METLELMAEHDFDSNDDEAMSVGFRLIVHLLRKQSLLPLLHFVAIEVEVGSGQRVDCSPAVLVSLLSMFRSVLMMV